MERTEELGLSGKLPIYVGGSPVELRTLNLEESEKWLGRLRTLDDKGIGVDELLDLVLAYDVEKVLGPRASVRKRMTQRELSATFNQMVRAELPFLKDAPSVESEFGRLLAQGVLGRLFLRESSTNGRSPSGDSPPKPSVPTSRKNGSSFTGPTGSAE